MLNLRVKLEKCKMETLLHRQLPAAGNFNNVHTAVTKASKKHQKWKKNISLERKAGGMISRLNIYPWRGV